MRSTLPHIYWINLDRAIERRERMTRRFDERGLAHTRVSAVDVKRSEDMVCVKWSLAPAGGAVPYQRSIEPIEAAVVAAHLKAIKRAYDDGCEQALIMEDDVIFELWDQWPEGWEMLQRALPAHYGIVQLCVAGTIELVHRLFLAREPLVRVTNADYASAAAYLIERGAMRELLDAYDRGTHFDISSRSAPAEHVLFYGPVLTSPSFSGPFVQRVPLFIYEGEDSLIADHHNDFLRPSRAFVLKQHQALVQETFSKQFPFFEELSSRPLPPAKRLLPRLFNQSASTKAPLPDASLSFFIEAGAWKSVATARASLSKAAARQASPLRERADAPRLIYVDAEEIEAFASLGLRRQRKPFGLLSVSLAPIAPSRSPRARDLILDHPLCRGWFATHAFAETDPRVTPIPLGIDAMLAAECYSQPTTSPLVWGPSPGSFLKYSSAMREFWRDISRWVPPLERRVPLALLDSAVDGRPEGLSSAVARCLGDSDVRVRWAHASRNAMFIAPFDGSDSTSIWTALLFGFVVAAPRWKRQEFLGDFPIAWFDHHSEITEDFVRSAVDRFRQSDHEAVLRDLSFGYWYEKMLDQLGE